MIHVKGNWYIDSDGGEYILQRDTGKKDKKGNAIFSDRSYHISIESALMKLARRTQMNVTELNDMELKEAIAVFQKITEQIKEAVKVGC